MFKTRKSMKKTINNLQKENKELKNKNEKALDIIVRINILATQNTCDREDVILRRIKELSTDSNLIR